MSQIPSTAFHHTYWRPILILSSRLRLLLRTGPLLYLQQHPVYTSMVPHSPLMSSTTHLKYFITLTKHSEECLEKTFHGTECSIYYEVAPFCSFSDPPQIMFFPSVFDALRKCMAIRNWWLWFSVARNDILNFEILEEQKKKYLPQLLKWISSHVLKFIDTKVIPRLTKIIRSGITFVSQNLR